MKLYFTFKFTTPVWISSQSGRGILDVGCEWPIKPKYEYLTLLISLRGTSINRPLFPEINFDIGFNWALYVVNPSFEFVLAEWMKSYIASDTLVWNESFLMKYSNL